MATIPSNTFKIWRDGEVVSANEYMKELEILRTAINSNGLDVAVLKNVALGVLQGVRFGKEFPTDPKAGDVFYRTDESRFYVFNEAEQWDALALNADLTDHVNNTENPHKVSAAQLGVFTKTQADEKFITAERGANANGEFVKWSNGVMECWRTDNFATTSFNAWAEAPVAGSSYYYIPGTWNFPTAFKAGTTVQCFAGGAAFGVAPETHTAWHISNTQCGVESGVFGLDVRGKSLIRHLYARGVWK